jgi:hypothetical protein
MRRHKKKRMFMTQEKTRNPNNWISPSTGSHILAMVSSSCWLVPGLNPRHIEPETNYYTDLIRELFWAEHNVLYRVGLLEHKQQVKRTDGCSIPYETWFTNLYNANILITSRMKVIPSLIPHRLVFLIHFRFKAVTRYVTTICGN